MLARGEGEEVVDPGMPVRIKTSSRKRELGMMYQEKVALRIELRRRKLRGHNAIRYTARAQDIWVVDLVDSRNGTGQELCRWPWRSEGGRIEVDPRRMRRLGGSARSRTLSPPQSHTV